MWLNDTLITGVSNTNTSITAVFNKQPEGTGVSVDTSISASFDVDAFQDTCTGGKAEPFHDDTAQVTFSARLLNPNTTFQPAQLHIEQYTIEYRQKNDPLGAPPIATFVGNQKVDIVPPTGNGVSTITATLEFVDLMRKDKYKQDMLSRVFSSTPANNYTAIYTFEGQNDFGTHFSFMAQTVFSIGDFNYCP